MCHVFHCIAVDSKADYNCGGQCSSIVHLFILSELGSVFSEVGISKMFLGLCGLSVSLKRDIYGILTNVNLGQKTCGCHERLTRHGSSEFQSCVSSNWSVGTASLVISETSVYYSTGRQKSR